MVYVSFGTMVHHDLMVRMNMNPGMIVKAFFDAFGDDSAVVVFMSTGQWVDPTILQSIAAPPNFI